MPKRTQHIRSAGRRRTWSRWLLRIAGAAGLFGLWLLWTAQVSASESVVGALATLLAMASVRATLARHLAPFRPRLPWLLLARRLPGYILTGTGVVLGALLGRMAGRHPGSVLLRIPFTPGAEDDRSAARRALAVTFTTFGPNSIAVGIDRKERTILVHELRETGPLGVARELGEAP